MSDVTIAHRGMIAAGGAHALAGGFLGSFKGEKGIYKLTDKALVLIINRRKGNSGKFEVYSINSLLENIEDVITIAPGVNANNPIQWKNNYNYTYFNGGKSYLNAKNNAGRAYSRCITILQQLHAQQLDVSLKTSALKGTKS